MADEKRKVVHSVPSSPVDSIKLFLSKTPIPTLERITKSPEFVKGVQTPVQEGNPALPEECGPFDPTPPILVIGV